MGHEKAGGGLPEVLFGRLQYLQARNPMREETLKGADGAESRRPGGEVPRPHPQAMRL